MADVKIVDIDGEQWNIKDQDARNKNAEQDTKIENLTTEINAVKRKFKRFYYDSNVSKDVLQNRVEAMLYCYDNSESGIATIRYDGGYYNNVILPAADLYLSPDFIEIDYLGNINIFRIKSRTEYEVVKKS